MQWQFNPYAVALLILAMPNIGFAAFAWRRRASLVVSLFILFSLLVVGALIAYAMELFSTQLASMLFWLRFEYIFSLTIPVVWLLFVLAYTGKDQWLVPWKIALLFVIPAIHLTLVWTNELHGLNWATVGTEVVDGLTFFKRTHGIGFLIGTGYLYLVTIAMTGVLVRMYLTATDLYRKQIAPLMLAAVIGMVGSILTVTGWHPFNPNVDLTMFGFGLMCFPVGWSLYRYRLLDLIPAAYDKVVKSLADAVIILDGAQRVVDVNPMAERLTGRNHASLVGKPFSEVLPNAAHLLQQPHADLQESRDELSFDADGAARYFDLRLSPLRDRHGRRTTAGYVVVLTDISARKQAEQTIRQYAAELEERNQDLDGFGHTVAHDLKAPLSVVLGYVQVLNTVDAVHNDPVAAQALGGIQRSMTKMNTMINDLLLFASLRDVSQVVSPVDMTVTAQTAVDRFRETIAERHLEINVAKDMPAALGYAPWIEEVFANLVSNAIKYIGKQNPRPRIEIRGARQNGHARYEVWDNGVGISAEDQAKLFQLFSRFHRTEASGSGIGLAIVQRIVTRLNGEVGVESGLGAGSTFWFTLPSADKEA